MRCDNQMKRRTAVWRGADSDHTGLALHTIDGAQLRLRTAIVAVLVATPLLAGGQASIDWWSVDGGGEIQAEGGDWTLSGTLGQWDGTEGNLLTGGNWQMTGGFWAVEAPASDGLFIDSFEN